LVRVVVTRRVPIAVGAALAADFELSRHDEETPPARDWLLREAAAANGIVSMLTDRIDGELLASAPHLRVVANYAVGVDNVDVEEATRRGIVVANTPDVLTRATAEMAIALMLALLRRVAEGDRLVRRRERWVWAPTFMLGRGLAGVTLGVVGPGRIGREVGRLAEAFGMRVVYVGRSELERALVEADVLSLHVPLTDQTRHLIGGAALRAMKPSAVLVNTSRGAVVDEAALVAALERGEIAGAALDVYEAEPEVSPALLALDNVVLAPHLGSATREAREAMGMLCVDALRAVLLHDRLPANAVNRPGV
jgi:glyoxylate reductase